ncbi:hypothetical protein NDU88_006430 [Pleurodeles waltl]|uniref:Uncharacterized protein n=1 Tax=Pleurodeles waltl TaxID=8319 RepID=A0AAV7X2M1_PLEWA|nr:hypothetical protein NDU88_006430 [Pleurodeles waltl]
MDKPNKVVQALQVLQEEGREDLLREDVLEQAWVGLRLPKRVSSEGVAAAVIACSSPVHPPKKFKQKSVAGRKVRISPERVVVEVQEATLGLPTGKMQAIRGGMKFVRHAGASFQQRVASRGHRQEERAKPGAVRLTSGEASGPGLGIQEIYPLVEGVPSTSRGTVVVEQEVIEDELLDYEEEEEAEEIHKGHRRAVQKGSRLVVSREANKKASRAIVRLEEIDRRFLREIYLEVRNIEHSQVMWDVHMLVWMVCKESQVRTWEFKQWYVIRVMAV